MAKHLVIMCQKFSIGFGRSSKQAIISIVREKIMYKNDKNSKDSSKKTNEQPRNAKSASDEKPVVGAESTQKNDKKKHK